jgi:uncharacterized protein with HEPN domain
MRRDPRTYLWDAAQAADHVERFVRGRTFEDYSGDVLLRSGVERQLEIVGEALNQLSKVDADLAAQIPELGNVVGFRTILVHGYAEVDDARVWAVVQEQLPALRGVVRQLLDDLGD